MNNKLIEGLEKLKKQMAEAGIENYEPPRRELYLCCPCCDNPYGMHHGDITVWNRVKEDGGGARHDVTGITVNTNPFEAGDYANGNPSARRDGLKIEFECEFCTGDTISEMFLTIAQHKGITVFSWDIFSLNTNEWLTSEPSFEI